MEKILIWCCRNETAGHVRVMLRFVVMNEDDDDEVMNIFEFSRGFSFDGSQVATMGLEWFRYDREVAWRESP